MIIINTFHYFLTRNQQNYLSVSHVNSNILSTNKLTGHDPTFYLIFCLKHDTTISEIGDDAYFKADLHPNLSCLKWTKQGVLKWYKYT